MDKSNKNIYIDENGTKIYKNSKGYYHREDGPAIEWKDGTKEWWVNGKFHKENGPAIEYANGDCFWIKKGMYHREDGPACVFENTNKHNSFFILGKKMKENEFNSWIFRIKILFSFT